MSQGSPESNAKGAVSPDTPVVSRLCYLGGGLCALNNAGSKIVISPGLGGPVLAEFDNPAFGQLFATLTKLGALVVGCEFYLDAEEVRGLRPAEFRVFMMGQGWLVHDTWDKWSQVASASMRADKMEVADGAARIAFEMQAVNHRLLELCRAYSNQLRSLVELRELEDYKRFEDLNTGPVIHCVHALFYELAVLRDYLAEFMARFVFCVQGKKGRPIRTMASLRSRLVAEPVEDPLCSEIIRSTTREAAEPGWLAILSAYRNLFTHVAPMELVALRSFTVQTYIPIKGDGRLPVLYHPLPANALELIRTRPNGFPFSRFADWATASAGHRPNRDEQPDALEYLHVATNRMAELAAKLIERSPVAPERLHLGPDDIIGPISVEPI